MGNHDVGHAMQRLAEEAVRNRKDESAIDILDRICNPFRNTDAEFEASDPDRPGYVEGSTMLTPRRLMQARSVAGPSPVWTACRSEVASAPCWLSHPGRRGSSTMPAMADSRTLERAYRVRLAPKPEQTRMLQRLLGAKRFVWNWALRRKEEAWRADCTGLNAVALSRQFTMLRQQSDSAWLASLPREPFNQVLRDFDRAWKNFFAGRAKRPRRKKRGSVDAVRFTLDQRRQQVDRERGVVQLDGIGKVRFRVSEALAGRLRSVTVRRDAAGRWFATFTADGVPAPAASPAEHAAVGIDLGLKDTAVLSTGEVIAAPRHLAAKLAKLRRYQRSFSRQQYAAARRQGLDPSKPLPKGTRIEVSNRMRRSRRQIGRLHAQVADARRDHQHQLTAKVVATARVIAIEDLAVKAMARGMGRRSFRRSVGDAGLGEIRRQLTYKANWHGRELVVVDQFYPSSKTCSGCGAVNAALTLRERQWTCSCGAEHHRDRNAAINLAREGVRVLKETSTPGSGGIDARGEGVCASTRASVDGQPTSRNRELIYRAAKPRTLRRNGVEPLRRREG